MKAYLITVVIVVLRGAAPAAAQRRADARVAGSPEMPGGVTSRCSVGSGALDTLGGDIGLVARREVRERVKGRTFRIGTLVILVAVAAAVTIPVLRKGHNVQHVGVVGTLSAPLRATIVAAGPAVGTKVVLIPEASVAAAQRALVAGRVAIVLVGTQRILVDQGLQPSDTSTTALLVRVISSAVSLQAGLVKAGISPLHAVRLANPPPLPIHSLKPAQHNQTARTTAIYGLILTYVLLTQFGTWLLMGVVEEKSSRVIEVLLSTLRAGQLLAGKVIGIGAVALLQAALIVGVALGLAAAVGSPLIHGTAAVEVASSLLWVVLGYAFYCWVYAAGGSLADRQEQVQTLAFPLQLPILFGYIVSITAIGSSEPVDTDQGPRLPPAHRPLRHARHGRSGGRHVVGVHPVGRPDARRHRGRGTSRFGRLPAGHPAHRRTRPPAPAPAVARHLSPAARPRRRVGAPGAQWRRDRRPCP